MSTIGKAAATSFSAVSRCGRRPPLHRSEYAAAICGMHTTSTVRQEPKLKENEPWAMPSPEAGPSRSATNATTDFERSELSDTPTQKSSDASDSVSSQIQPSTSSSSSSVPKPNLPKSRTRLPEWIPPHWQSHLQPDAQWRKDMLNRRKRLAQQAGQQLTVLGMKLNEVTGYKEVERLKELVGEKETRLKWLRDDTKLAKEAYERAVTTRATTQSDVNSLLERKHAWSDEDVSRFTQLVRSDHSSNQAVTTTAISLKETELATDKAFSDLMQAILQRYHEEQVWSDKIRNVSTYAGLAGLLVNLVVFVGAIAFVEPWKRKRLVERLEERIEEMMGRVEGSIGHLGEKVERDMAALRLHAGAGSGPGLLEASPTVPAEQEQAPIQATTPPAVMPTSSPILQSFERIAPYLDKIAPPSRDRDIAFTAGCGAVLGVTMTALGIWLGR